MPYRLPLIAISVVLVISISYWLLANLNNQPPKLQKAFYLQPTSKPIAAVTGLVNEQGQAFELEHFNGHWSLLFFGFTHCPDICPTELLFLKQVYEGLALQHKPQVYLVSLDHLRDTPDTLKDYVQFFHPSFQALSGSQQSIHQFSQSFGVYYEFVVQHEGQQTTISSDQPFENTDNFTINHTAWVYLINPQGKIHAGFSSPHQLPQIINDLESLIEHY